MRIDAGVARVAGMRSGAPWLPGVLRASIELVGHDGLGWPRKCLPDGLPIQAAGWISSNRGADVGGSRAATAAYIAQ